MYDRYVLKYIFSRKWQKHNKISLPFFLSVFGVTTNSPLSLLSSPLSPLSSLSPPPPLSLLVVRLQSDFSELTEIHIIATPTA